LTFDGDTAALARALGAARVILVADAGLGVINSVRLSAAALGGLPLVVHLNRFDAADDLHRRNAEWLGARDGFDLTTSIEELLVKVRA
jgi:dethiobiotin synthetase